MRSHDKKSLLLRRWLAFSLDALLVAGYALLLFVAVRSAQPHGSAPHIARDSAGHDWDPHLRGFLTLTMPTVVALAALEASPLRATPGKRLFGLAVTGRHGLRLGLPASLLRNGLKFLPWEISHWSLWQIEGWPTHPQDPPATAMAGFGLTWALAALYVGSMIASREGVAVYDRLAGSRVERRKARPPIASPDAAAD